MDGAWLLFMLLFGWQPATAVPLMLSFRVKNDATGVALLEILEGHGDVLQMLGFDGKNLQVVYRPDPVRPRQWELALPSKGVTLLEARALTR